MVFARFFCLSGWVDTMRLPEYVELHAISNFTFLRGASHPHELVERALALGYRGLALTDACSLAGVVRAHLALREARDAGVPGADSFRLLIGSEFQVFEDAQDAPELQDAYDEWASCMADQDPSYEWTTPEEVVNSFWNRLSELQGFTSSDGDEGGYSIAPIGTLRVVSVNLRFSCPASFSSFRASALAAGPSVEKPGSLASSGLVGRA